MGEINKKMHPDKLLELASLGVLKNLSDLWSDIAADRVSMLDKQHLYGSRYIGVPDFLIEDLDEKHPRSTEDKLFEYSLDDLEESEVNILDLGELHELLQHCWSHVRISDLEQSQFRYRHEYSERGLFDVTTHTIDGNEVSVKPSKGCFPGFHPLAQRYMFTQQESSDLWETVLTEVIVECVTCRRLDAGEISFLVWATDGAKTGWECGLCRTSTTEGRFTKINFSTEPWEFQETL